MNSGNTKCFIEKFCVSCFERFYSNNESPISVWSSSKTTIDNILQLVETIHSSLVGGSLDDSPEPVLYALVLISKCLIVLKPSTPAEVMNRVMLIMHEMQAIAGKRRHTLIFSKVGIPFNII